MINFYNHIAHNSSMFRSLRCEDNLFTMFNCGEEDKYQDIWSHHNYIVYVAKGRKTWHTNAGVYDLTEGSLVFVRKGACIIEQFFDADFCLFLFFITDEFICELLKEQPRVQKEETANVTCTPVLQLHSNKYVEAFFENIMVYFNDTQEPDPALLKLKFRELILILTANPLNNEMLHYFCSLQNKGRGLVLQTVMEDNFCYNLKLEDFAKLSCRSLSTFKRDFEKIYKISPSKWLLEKRLNHAKRLMEYENKSVKEAAFESGFENASHFSRAFHDYFGAPPSLSKVRV